MFRKLVGKRLRNVKISAGLQGLGRQLAAQEEKVAGDHWGNGCFIHRIPLDINIY